MIKCDIFSWALGFALLLCVTEANQLSAQGCPDLRGTWKVTESATLTIRVNGESETITEGDTGTIQINQDGCAVSYVKSLGGFEAERLGTIEGNTVTLTGIAAVPVQGVTCSKNTLILVGTIDGNRIDATSTVDIECTDGIVVQTVTGGGPVIFTGPPRGSITVTSPNGGEIWRLGTTETVTWQSEGLDGSNVRLDLYQSGNFLSAIESSSQDGGNFHWDIPNDLRTGDDYSIRIAATSDDTINDFTDAVFEIRHDVIVESLGGSTQLGSGANLGDQWWWSEWVGVFNWTFSPWLFHAEHGWQYVIPEGIGEAYFYDLECGDFWWSSSSFGPFTFYSFARGTFNFYFPGTSSPRQFVDLETEEFWTKP